MISAREVALLTLSAWQHEGAWSDGYLKKMLKEHGLDRREAALATRLCYGVLQNKILIDWQLERVSKKALDKLEVKVMNNLRVAAYQLMFLDKIPPSAAVNEAVELTRKHCRNQKAAGMVNAILRTLLRSMPLVYPKGADELESLSIATSHPKWLVNTFVDILGFSSAKEFLRANNEQLPPTALQLNLCKASKADILEKLQAEGCEPVEHPWLTGCVTISKSGDLERLQSYQQGLYYVQDPAARLAISVLELKPGQRVLDCCAAPGGKSFAAAIDMENRGEIISCDIHPHKIKLLEAGRDRLGLSLITARQQSAAYSRIDWLELFDAVIADVPCSGFGIIRKKPDIRYKMPQPLKNLPRIQLDILDNCSGYVRPGGTLLYSTCTLLPRENEDVVERFLRQHEEFELAEFDTPQFGRQDGMMTLWPHIHGTDGFFIAKLHRKDDAL